MRALRLAFLAVLPLRRFRVAPAMRRASCSCRTAPSTTWSSTSVRQFRHHRHLRPHGLRDQGFGLRRLHGALPLRDAIDTREASQITDQQTTTFEDAEGKTFSFVTKSYTDQNLDKETAGQRDARDGTGVKIQIEKPEHQELRPAADAVPDAAPGRPDRQGQDRRDVLRDQHLSTAPRTPTRR